MPKRHPASEQYRFGFGTQEQDKEIHGDGNSYTAMYWQYDPRTARRWNLDPKFTADVSRYAVNGNNPIIYNDPNGDFKTRFGASLYKIFHGGEIRQDDGGEYYVSKQLESSDRGVTVQRRFNWSGRDVGKNLALEAKKKQWQANFKRDQRLQEWERLGIWDPTVTQEQARRNAINLSVGLVLPNFIKGGTVAANSRTVTDVAPKAIGGNADDFVKLLTPNQSVDVTKILHRGTTGSEAGANLIILTDDAVVAATYVKNGGQIMSYPVSDYALKALEFTGHLTKATGTHGVTGKINTEFFFEGAELVKALMKIAKPH